MIERLEPRRLFAVTLSHRVLTVTGSLGVDQITLLTVPQVFSPWLHREFIVRINGKVKGQFDRNHIDRVIGVVNAMEAPRDRYVVEQHVCDVREEIEHGDAGEHVHPGR